jgi:hypothetical protein
VRFPWAQDFDPDRQHPRGKSGRPNGWKAPEDADEPLTLDPNVFGTLVHALLRDAVERLEAYGGMAGADQHQIGAALAAARDRTIADWEDAQPLPPDVIW